MNIRSGHLSLSSPRAALSSKDNVRAAPTMIEAAGWALTRLMFATLAEIETMEVPSLLRQR
jgi:hypothetical protein